MYVLSIPDAPRWVDLAGGVRVLLRPVDTAVMEGARLAAGQRVADLAEQYRDLRSLGADLSGLPDLSTEARRRAVSHMFFLQALAAEGISDWSGIGDPAAPGQPWPCTPEHAAALMRDPRQADALLMRLYEPWSMLSAEGNASAPGPDGTGAAAPGTAPDAGRPVPPAPEADAPPTGSPAATPPAARKRRKAG